MNLLFIYSYSEDLGGIQKIIRDLSKHFTKKGYNINIITRHRNYRKKKIEKKVFFDVFYFNLRNIFDLFFKKQKIIFCFEPVLPFLILSLFFKIFNKKIILIFCGTQSELPKNKIYRKIKLFIYKFFDKTIYVSDYTMKTSLGDKINKFKNKEIIYPSVDFFSYNISDLKNDELVTLGRISKRKDYISMLTMFSLLIKKRQNIKLNIIGGLSDLRSRYFLEIKNKIKELNISNNVNFFINTDEETKKKVLARSKLYISTSKHEMFGIATVEAMASGLPVIAYDNTATSEIVKSAGGILVDDGNYEKMALLINNLLNNDKEIIKMAKKSLECFKKYNTKIMLEKYDKIIKGF